MSDSRKGPKTTSSSRLRLKATNDFAKQFKNIFASPLDYTTDLTLICSAAALLSHCASVPLSVTEFEVWGWIKSYCARVGLPVPLIDKTAFAAAGFQLFSRICSNSKTASDRSSERRVTEGTKLRPLGLSLSQHHAAIECLAKFAPSVHFDDPLTFGWLMQCQQSESVRENVEGKFELNRLTRWFTPAWISEYLVLESINGRADCLFMDPAVGAGHLFVEALHQLVTLQEKVREDRLAHILDQQLYGLDIDPDMIDAAALITYATARQMVPNSELPLPHLYIVSNKQFGQAELGSLWFSTGEDADLTQVGKDVPVSIDALPHNFEAIAMNPPYLSNRAMPEQLALALAKYYPNSKYDLYAAFLEMSLSKLSESGRLATICQQSFLTVQRYHALRESMLAKSTFESVIQLGPGCFATKCGEKVNNAIVVLKAAKYDESDQTKCRRLLSEREKNVAEANGIKNTEYRLVTRKHSEAIVRSVVKGPLAFWAPPEVLLLFTRYPSLAAKETGIICTNGLFTCNNREFLKPFAQVTDAERDEFVRYDKGGGRKWFSTTKLMLKWGKDGASIREYRRARGQSSRLPGEDYYFKAGITYSYIGTKSFTARLLTPEAVFDIASSGIFSNKTDLLYLLGWLNSSLTRYTLSVLNPTINFQIGDIRRLPFAQPSKELEAAVSQCAGRAVQIAQQFEKTDPTSPSFEQTMRVAESEEDRRSRLLIWQKEEFDLQSKIDTLIFEHYQIPSKIRLEIEADPWVKNNSSAFLSDALGRAPVFWEK